MARTHRLVKKEHLSDVEQIVDEIDSGMSENSSYKQEEYFSHISNSANSFNYKDENSLDRLQETSTNKAIEQVKKETTVITEDTEIRNELIATQNNNPQSTQIHLKTKNVHLHGYTHTKKVTSLYSCFSESTASNSSQQECNEQVMTEASVAEGSPEVQNRLTLYAKRNICKDSVLSAWHIIFSYGMIHHIKQCTEAEAHRRLGRNLWSVSLEELDALFSIIYARGVFGVKKTPLNDLWSNVWGPPFFSQIMPRDRFMNIMRFLRFDLGSQRSLDVGTDNFAMASSIWNPFVENSTACFEPGTNLTIDEQLLPTKTKCPFVQYRPSKLGKYGIQFWLLVCLDTNYIFNGFPYTEADNNNPVDQGLVIAHLIKSYLEKRSDIPPETLQLYNQAECGIVDRMVRMYTTKAASKRWPMQVLFNILDLSAINAWILYKEVNRKHKFSRRKFILQLCEELRAPYIASKINKADGMFLAQVEIGENICAKRLKCKVQRFCKNNTSKNICVNCKKAVCGKCSSKEVTCVNCIYKIN